VLKINLLRLRDTKAGGFIYAIFSFEGTWPSVLREDGTAFTWSSFKGVWGEMSARALLSDTRTDELTASEFETRLVVAGIEPSTLVRDLGVDVTF